MIENNIDIDNQNDIKKSQCKSIDYTQNDIKKLHYKKIKVFFSTLSIILLLFLIFNIINIIKYNSTLKNFKSFDLDNLKRQELVVQTIDFKKFLVHGTEGNNDYTDELQIFHVTGKVNVFFTDIENIKIDEDKSDYMKKILRLRYDRSNKKKIPFGIEIIINENDIQKVADYESKELDIFGMKSIFQLNTDLIKPEYSQAELVENAKSQLLEEFTNQLLPSSTDFTDLEIYTSFLNSLEEIVKKNSDWKEIELLI